jgi:NACHT domain
MEPQVSIEKLPGLGDRKVFGREIETEWLDRCWDERAGVASIVAPGGVGKSALVWDWLRRMQADAWRDARRVYGWSFYSQGTRETNTSADLFVAELLRWLGDPAPDEGSPWEKGKRLARAVREKRTLLVLDGVEPLQWGPGEQEGRIKDPTLATLVRALGAQNEGLCVITSRLAVREVADFAEEKCRVLDLGTLSEEAGAEVLRAWGVEGKEKERTIVVLDGVEPLQWGPGVEAGKLKDPALQALVKELGAQNKGLYLVTSRLPITDLEALFGDKVQEHGLEHLSDEAGAELLKARGARGLRVLQHPARPRPL